MTHRNPVIDTYLGDLSPGQIRRAHLRNAGPPSNLQLRVLDVYGNIIHTEPRDMYLSRAASIAAGVKVDTPALTLNRLCGSGLQAIVSGAQSVMLGDADVTGQSRLPRVLELLR